jgi:hypothetical protein
MSLSIIIQESNTMSICNVYLSNMNIIVLVLFAIVLNISNFVNGEVVELSSSNFDKVCASF